jgi:hypothetical protein
MHLFLFDAVFDQLVDNSQRMLTVRYQKVESPIHCHPPV